jgi:hypothetical protein
MCEFLKFSEAGLPKQRANFQNWDTIPAHSDRRPASLASSDRRRDADASKSYDHANA